MARLLQRLYRLWHHRWVEAQVRETFPDDVLQRLERAIAASERLHTGQLRLCVEGGLPYSYIWRNASARDRAVGLFGKLRVWDTEHNNGVLIYLLLAEHAIEIVADRGLAGRVSEAQWREVCQLIETGMGEGRAEHLAVDSTRDELLKHAADEIRLALAEQVEIGSVQNSKKAHATPSAMHSSVKCAVMRSASGSRPQKRRNAPTAWNTVMPPPGRVRQPFFAAVARSSVTSGI